MVDQIMQLMMGGSPMVAFAVYLIWSNSRSEKKLDDLSADFGARLDRLIEENKTEERNLRDRYEQREDEQRDRWQGVVNQVQSDRENMERDILRNTLSTQESITKMAGQVDALSQTLQQVDNKLSQVYDKVGQIDSRTVQISENLRR